MANGNSKVFVLNENVSVSMQPALVKRLEKYCFKHDLQKSQVISKAVRRFLAGQMADDPSFWEEVYDKYDETGKL